MRPRRALLSGFVLLAPAIACAQPATDSAAHALQQQLRGWFKGMLGPAVPLPELPLRVTPEGDRFRASLPLDGLPGSVKGEISATLKPLDGGRWAIESLLLPRTGALALPPQDGGKGPTNLTYTLGGQEFRAAIDPALAAPSSVSLELRDIAVTAQGDGERHEQRVDRYAFQGSLIPGAEGRVNLRQEGTVDGWRSAIRSDDGTDVTFSVGRVRQSSQLTGLSRERSEQLVLAFNALLDTLPSPGSLAQGKPDLTDADRARLRTLIGAFRDLLVRAEAGETLENIAVEVAGVGGATLRQLRLGLGSEAPGGLLHAWIDLALEGLAVADLPPDLTRFLPTKVALRPALSGISADRLTRLGLAALEDKPDESKLEADALALLTQEGASVGIEALTIELDKLRIEGSGRMRLLAPNKPGIEARLSASGLDALMAEASGNPMLQQAMPFIVLARGLARPEGKLLVWDIAMTTDQALVNGVDVMKMGDPPPPPAQKKPSRR